MLRFYTYLMFQIHLSLTCPTNRHGRHRQFPGYQVRIGEPMEILMELAPDSVRDRLKLTPCNHTTTSSTFSNKNSTCDTFRVSTASTI